MFLQALSRTRCWPAGSAVLVAVHCIMLYKLICISRPNSRFCVVPHRRRSAAAAVLCCCAAEHPGRPAADSTAAGRACGSDSSSCRWVVVLCQPHFCSWLHCEHSRVGCTLHGHRRCLWVLCTMMCAVLDMCLCHVACGLAAGTDEPLIRYFV
jgi:hypothetical protein